MATIAASLASFPFLLPHVLEDFNEGIAQRVGLSTGAGAFLLGGFLALQWLGLILVGQGRRGGFALTFWAGLVWVTGAVVDHGPALVAGEFRGGGASVLWVVGVIVTQVFSTSLAGYGWWAAWGE
jgi:hypothetical protein